MLLASNSSQRKNGMTTAIRPGLENLESRIVPSTFKVNTTLDTVAVNLRTGKDASGHISLRSAIQAANSRPNADTILLPKGTLTLTIGGANENASATGDLDIKSNVSISGKGSTKTIIDAAAIDRVLQILSGKVLISGVTIEHGRANDGGGVLNSGGKVALTADLIANNLAEGGNGGNGTNGTGNGSGGGGFAGGAAFGGGISNESGSLTISRSTIVANQAIGGTGGNGGSGGFMQGIDGTGSGNGQAAIGGKGGSGGTGGAGIGGGIFNGIGSQLSVVASTITRNIASGGKGGSGGAGGDAFGGDASDNMSGAAGNGGDAIGGASGAGGACGPGEGGGLFNSDIVAASGGATTFSDNQATGGSGGSGNLSGSGVGGRGAIGFFGQRGGTGGVSRSGNGGAGGSAGFALGGGLVNGFGATLREHRSAQLYCQSGERWTGRGRRQRR